MGLVTGTAVATIYYSSVRLGLPVPHHLGPDFFPPWVSQQVGSGPVGLVMGRKPPHHSYFQGEHYHGNEMKVGFERLGKCTLASRGG